MTQESPHLSPVPHGSGDEWKASSAYRRDVADLITSFVAMILGVVLVAIFKAAVAEDPFAAATSVERFKVVVAFIGIASAVHLFWLYQIRRRSHIYALSHRLARSALAALDASSLNPRRTEQTRRG